MKIIGKTYEQITEIKNGPDWQKVFEMMHVAKQQLLLRMLLDTKGEEKET